MRNEITIKLNKKTAKLPSVIQNGSSVNMKTLIRENYKSTLNNFVGIDNSEHLNVLEKGRKKNA